MPLKDLGSIVCLGTITIRNRGPFPQGKNDDLTRQTRRRQISLFFCGNGPLFLIVYPLKMLFLVKLFTKSISITHLRVDYRRE